MGFFSRRNKTERDASVEGFGVNNDINWNGNSVTEYNHLFDNDNNVTQSKVDDDNGKVVNSTSSCNCKKYSRPRNFKQLVNIIKAAELRLIDNGLKGLGDRINCIRGIYYGATWSLDYQQEHSNGRNNGFRIYTATSIEYDAREELKCSKECTSNLFNVLFNSPEIFDSSNRMVDFGHLMIGLDARRSLAPRYVNLPFGGTGLENVTWVGDLGGGAGMLSFRRVKSPSIRAKKLVYDSRHDYGASVNIEGDIAGYVVGSDDDNKFSLANPTKNMKYLYQGLEKYFDKTWEERAFRFLGMLDADFNGSEITNKQDVLDDMIDSIEGMAQSYIALRAKDKNYNTEQLLKSFGYIESSASEVSSIFMDSLLWLIKNPKKKFTAVSNPDPTIVNNSTIEDAMKKADEVLDWIKRFLD